MCASVCPSQALFFGTREELAALRPNSRPVNSFQFGQQTITTKVNMLIPKDDPINLVNVAEAMFNNPAPQEMDDDPLLANLYVG